MTSKYIHRLEEIQRRVPVVGDKALIDLVNGIQVSKDIIRYRKNRGFFGQLIDTLNGSDRKRQLLLDGNLIAGQEALHQWVLEICDSLRISQVALEVTQQSLLEAREAIRRQRQRLQMQEKTLLKFDQRLQMQEEVLLEFDQRLDQLAQKVGTKFSELEKRVGMVEAKLAVDHIVTAWAAEQTYTNLPWPIQVALLVREVFSGAVAFYKLEESDKTEFRSFLINKILDRSPPTIPKFPFGLADLLKLSWVEMRESDRELSAALLEVRSIPRQRLQNIPILFTIGTTLELATLPEEARPRNPEKCAIALCRAQIDNISFTTDREEFVKSVVEETANDCLAMMQ